MWFDWLATFWAKQTLRPLPSPVEPDVQLYCQADHFGALLERPGSRRIGHGRSLANHMPGPQPSLLKGPAKGLKLGVPNCFHIPRLTEN